MLNDTKNLYYKTAAKNWLEALPLGNGFLGAMVYGRTDKEIIAMNSDTLWSGYPRESVVKEYAYESFLKARELVLNGKYREGQDIIERDILANCSQTYLPLCDIKIEYTNRLSRKKDYKRYLDLENGINTVEFTRSNIAYKRTSFVTAVSNAYIDRIISSDKKGVNFKLSLSCKLRSIAYVENGVLILDGRCPADSYTNHDKKSKKYQYPDEPAKQGMYFRCAVKVIADGEVSYTDNSIVVSNSSEATVVFCSENSFNGYDKHPVLEGKEYKKTCLDRLFSVSNIPYQTLEKEHIKDFSKYFNRVTIDIGTDNLGDIPTDKRLIRHKNGKSDIGLYTLMFNFGRYLVISGSRSGSQAMNLQGIWNNSVNPPWSSNYTVNINTEMNYWPVLPCNLFEFNQPLIQLTKDLSEKGEKTAKFMYNARGFCAHHNIDLWRFNDPAKGNAQWGFWSMSGAWFCQHIYNHYLYTQDEKYLKETAYPILRKCSFFLIDMLVEDKDGYLIMTPSTSPENDFIVDGKRASVSETSTMTMALVKEVLSNTLKSANILGDRDELIETIEKYIPRLLPFKIGSDGQLLEWYKEMKEQDPHHRHKSHLYPLHPASLITPDETPELANACRRSLELRGDNGTGWSLGWKINMWARLWDGDHALKLLDMQLSPVPSSSKTHIHGGGTYPNLFDAHPPFQIDGNFGCASGICEMLLQSRESKIFLLPALPSSWENGKVTGLKAVGNITVDIEWENCEVKNYKLCGNTDGIEIYCKGKRI